LAIRLTRIADVRFFGLGDEEGRVGYGIDVSGTDGLRQVPYVETTGR
jgi:hypothetical protein